MFAARSCGNKSSALRICGKSAGHGFRQQIVACREKLSQDIRKLTTATHRLISVLDQAAPDFELPATGGKTFKLSALLGQMVVLYFYPKDNTPGCTTEGQHFRDLHPQFTKAGCVVCGISRDSMKSHENFKAKMGFPFDLLSDADELACKRFNVIKLKNMYGKKVRGIERSTFVIDRNGLIRREWRGVKVPGHVPEVLEFVKSIA
jgi:thioredoxin-dependent peroxiredoxin